MQSRLDPGLEILHYSKTNDSATKIKGTESFHARPVPILTRHVASSARSQLAAVPSSKNQKKKEKRKTEYRVSAKNARTGNRTHLLARVTSIPIKSYRMKLLANKPRHSQRELRD